MKFWIVKFQRYADDRYRDPFEDEEPFKGPVFLFKSCAKWYCDSYTGASDHLSGEIMSVSLEVINIRAWAWGRWIHNKYCWLMVRWYNLRDRVKGKM